MEDFNLDDDEPVSNKPIRYRADGTEKTGGMGKASLYDPVLAEKILNVVRTTSMGIKRICKEIEGCVSHETIRNWLRNNEEFRKQYNLAKEEQADNIVEEMIDIADEGVDAKDVAGAMNQKLRVETRKWLAEKLRPKVYGNKTDTTIDLNVNHNLSQGAFKDVLEAIRQKRQLDEGEQQDQSDEAEDIDYEEERSDEEE